MKFFADTSFLANLYLDQSLGALARQIQTKHQLVASLTPLVQMEMHLAALRQAAGGTAGWKDFQTDVREGRLIIEPISWERLIDQAEALAVQHRREVQPGTLDALHVASALHLGATHFISFDELSRQRAFARAVGLKLLPQRLPRGG